MNKKIIGVILAVSLLSVFMINFISATTLLEGITSVWESVIELLEPIFKFLLGEVGEGLLFSKVLFFVIIVGIVWLSLGKIDFFSDNKFVLGIITFAVAVLAVRGIGSLELIKTILLPYSVLGITLTAGIPFVIYFLVINVGFEKQPNIVRKIAWIFFAVIFIGLWFTRKESLEGFHYIYLGTAVVAVIMAWMDGTIKKWLVKFEEQKFQNLTKQKRLIYLKKELAEIEDEVSKGHIKPSEAHDTINDIKRRIKYVR